MLPAGGSRLAPCAHRWLRSQSPVSCSAQASRRDSGGRSGTNDVPVQATVWIEEPPAACCGAKIAVPADMRTRNPDGTATDSNIRRFRVRTDETID